MASAKDIRRRIKSVKSIQQITQAMKLVASARLQKAQSRVQAARPYAEKIQRIIADLAASGASLDHPLLESRDENTVTAIIIGADRGLAGSYPTNLLRVVNRFVERYHPDQLRLHVIGKKTVGAVRKLGLPIESSHQLPGTDLDFGTVRPLSQLVQKQFASGETDAVYLIYSEFKTAMTQTAVRHRLLPVEPPSDDDLAGGSLDYIFEPEPDRLLAHLLSRYVDTQLYRAVLESIASEQGARMTAMSSATTNAGEMIERLTLSLNRARQAAITAEIAEIVGAADAVS